MKNSTASTSGVTDREREVLALVSGHLTNAEIAERLTLSVRTVESHVSSLIRKLDVLDRRSLARKAHETGVLQRGHRHWPSHRSELVGREAEVTALTTALARNQMVTVAGPGGVGKTRLASAVAEDVAARRPDGGWFVDLSQVADSRGVVPAVATAVGVVEQPGRSVAEALISFLAPVDGILLVDNCEHVLEEVQRCVERLVAGCSRLTVVATSRAPLRAPYEHVYELSGLDLDDAVQLFCDRATAAGGHLQPSEDVATICSRLEGMALAIELAAARYPSLGLDGLAGALSDPLGLLGNADGARQRSLRATIAWSADLLTVEERSVLAGCSIFASPFTVAAVRRIAAPATSDAEVGALVARLADQHLLQVHLGAPTTYRFQEVVRQYAAEQLGDRAGDVGQRHAAWVSDELAALAGIDHDDAWCDAFDRLGVEVRAALSRGDAGAALAERFAEELVQRGRLEEAQRRFEQLAAADPSDRVRLLLLAAGAAAARLVGDDAMRLLEEAAAAAGGAGDADAAAEALSLSVIYAALSPGIMANPPRVETTEQRLTEARRLAPTAAAARATLTVAEAAWLDNADPRALAAARDAAAAAIAAGRPVAAAAALDTVCSVLLLRGEYTAALDSVNERGAVLDPEPVDATTAYAYNDYLLMGCEVSLAAGDLPGAGAYADRLSRLPCYRDYVHPALARRLEVDLLSGDFTSAVVHGERFHASWERAACHRASTLAVGAYSLAVAYGILGRDDDGAEWRRITLHLAADRADTIAGLRTGWAPTLDAVLLLDRGEAQAAVERLHADLDDPLWDAWNTRLWRPWYAAAWAEAAALGGLDDAPVRLAVAKRAARENRVAAALVDRAAALMAPDVEAVKRSATVLDALGAAYQANRSRSLALRMGTS